MRKSRMGVSRAVARSEPVLQATRSVQASAGAVDCGRDARSRNSEDSSSKGLLERVHLVVFAADELRVVNAWSGPTDIRPAQVSRSPLSNRLRVVPQARRRCQTRTR